MRRAGVVALALLTILAGCPGDGDVEDTVTPADVPEVPSPTTTSTPASTVDCGVASPPPAPDRTPAPPSDPASVPESDGVVDAVVLADRHASALSAHRYRLETSGRSVFATANRSALRASFGRSGSPISTYAIDGTRYTYYFEDGGRQRFGVSAYDGGPTLTDFGGTVSLTGEPTVERVLSTYHHRVATVRENGWTVLRASQDTLGEDEIVGLKSLNSTVLVDRRGIVRRIDTRVAPDPGTDVPLSGTTSLSITQVGDAAIDRPSWVCSAVDQVGTVSETPTPRETAGETPSESATTGSTPSP